MYCAPASKVAVRFAVTPPSSSSVAAVWVGVSGVNGVPARGPISITRSMARVDANPATRRIGPSSATIAVT